MSAEFPEIVQLVSVGEEFPPQHTPPPQTAEFPEIVQLVSVGERIRSRPRRRRSSRRRVPRDRAVGQRRGGALAVHAAAAAVRREFPEIVQLVSVGEGVLAVHAAAATPTEFPEIVQLVSVGEDW